VIVRPPQLSLIALFHAIFVHERSNTEFHVLAKPTSLVIVRKYAADDTFQNVIRHRFACVMTSGQQDAMSTIPIQTTDGNQLDIPPVRTLAQRPHA